MPKEAPHILVLVFMAQLSASLSTTGAKPCTALWYSTANQVALVWRRDFFLHLLHLAAHAWM